MPVYEDIESIRQGLALFNQRLLNRGYSFRVYSKDSHCLYIQGSFDFGYYVNVHIEFRDLLYTNIGSKEEWPDAWHENQLFLLEDEETTAMIDLEGIEVTEEKKYIGFVFNICGRDKFHTKGCVICSQIYIRWEHPYNEA
ncbi:MAG: hypothetical protein K1X55_09445 [Chitinophagales bacterium]|nr:hypothetical protein [Chitinophagales bacterium]